MPSKLTISFLYLIVISTYFIIFLDQIHIVWLCREDGPVENMGTVFFIIASGLFLAAYFYSAGAGNSLAFFRTHRNVWYLLLGILFLICFGEEISWGQRIFNWPTPKWLYEINAQGETNLHNIWLFHGHGSNPAGSQESIWSMTFNMHKLFSMFWLFFCVIVPLMERVSLKSRIFLKHIGMPITPLWIGVFFLTHAAAFHLIYNSLADLPYNVVLRLNELKESNYAFIFIILAYHELRRNLMHSARNEKPFT